jgi:hypothetical protein
MGTPDGKSVEAVGERGAVQYSDGESHLPETSSGPVEVVVVELKTATAAQSPK